MPFYFLKNSLCNGCRNPHLISTAKTELRESDTILGLGYSTIEIKELTKND